jgi:hypothetical protein
LTPRVPDAGTEFRGSAVESPSRTNLAFQVHTRVHVPCSKKRARFNIRYVVLSIIIIIDCILLCMNYVSMHQTMPVRNNQGNLLQLHLIKNRETKRQIAHPEQIPQAKIQYQDCQPLASPPQLNNLNLPSKMAEHENETDSLSHLSRRVLRFVLFAYRASTKCSLQVLGDVVGVGEGHAGILKTLPLPSQLWTSYLL